MKKIIQGMMVLAITGLSMTTFGQEKAETSTPAASSQERLKFYYYPSTNVYFNDLNSEYLYYDSSTSNWVTVKQLPTTILVQPSDMKYAVYHNGTDIWKDNETHRTKYKTKKGGTIKIKSKP